MKDKKGQEVTIGDFVVDSWNDLSRIMRIDGEIIISEPLLANSEEYKDDDSDEWMLRAPAIVKIEEDEAIIFMLKGPE